MNKVNQLRVRKINDISYQGSRVIYHMCRDIRTHDNDALLFAEDLAKEKDAELVVVYTIWNYLWKGATRRFYDWVIPSLVEVESELRKHNIPLVILFEEKIFSKKRAETIFADVGAVVIDELPLSFMRKWKELFLKQYSTVPLYEVDAHNCIPVWELSQKQEFAAHTIRNKVHKKINNFLDLYRKITLHTKNEKVMKEYAPIDWDYIAKNIVCDERVFGTGVFVPGQTAAKKMLSGFLHNKLDTYDTSRNEINSDGQSNLSAYISHGNISRRRILLELIKSTGIHIEDSFDTVKNGSNGKEGSLAAFIEETLVRAEICENFCFYNELYDSYNGFPAWAKLTLTKAKTDKRDYIYTRKEFEEAKTHDELWNAAQMQMVTSGKMHGYMRMYWAKKILEWSVTPEDAMDTAVYLNDTYELDGRDPGGYAGCAWSIGGLHDRAWFPRPIFGTIRYMATSGVARRGKIQVYINRWLS
ncbi:MAG: deoxyribodipyrimidine photo-lyase [Candidatus Pacebacteria bacterium]|nr:deoxyribodipyrimidine photo-lyase [Candidatus Paceibacterota bacterium]MBP9866658.1 deoxyribodipyrimidine photo-lyase [Candidatus Paceibacterota bacterium]